MTRNGLPIEDQALRLAIHTGIGYRPIIAQMVPMMEERDAAIFAGYTWPEWRMLDWSERAATVAHYRLYHLIRLHSEEAASMRAELDRQRSSS